MDKFARNIKIELIKNPKDRSPVMQILKTSKEEYDRLEETAPPIDPKIIYQFKKTFGDIQDLIKPDILGKITPTFIFDRDEHKDDDDEDDNEIQRIIKANIDLQEDKKKLEQERTVENFKLQYLQTKGRLPSSDEIDNFFLDKV